MYISKTGIAAIAAAYIAVPLLLGSNTYVLGLIVSAMIIGGLSRLFRK